MEFFEVITLIPYWDDFGHEHLEEQHEAYFQHLENAYEYCLDRYKGTEELPLLSEIEDKFYPQVENDFNVGDFTIKKIYFDDSY